MKKSNGKVGYNPGEQYRKLLNWIGDPLLILEKQTLNVLDCNQAAERAYGYTPDEWKALTLFDLHLPEDQARVKQFVEKNATEAASPFAHLTKDGRQLEVDLVIDKARHQGQPAWIVLMRDRNGQEQIKAELEKARTAAVESARLKSEFLRNVGHEIRTPLNGILGMTELTLSSRLVELMGGRIWVESEAGHGSVFHFTVTLGVQSNQYADEFLPDCPGDSMPVRMDSETQRC